MPNFTSWVLNEGCYFRYCVVSRYLDGWGVGSLHVVLGSLGAGFGVFLVEGDPFGLAHEGELDVDSVEEIGRQESDVGFACCDYGQYGPVLANEGDDVDAVGPIKQRAGPNEIEKTFLLRMQCKCDTIY
jgi:hypothetical protein